MTVTLIRAVIIYIFVVLAVRVMGKRQIGELKPHELVITILVSQIASIPLQDNAMPLANSLIPLLILISFEIIASIISMKSIKFRNALQGKPIFVIRHGKLDEKQMRRLRFTMDDLVDALRQKDVFDISQVDDAVVETNGSLSVLLKPEYGPVTPQQLNLEVEDDGMPVVIVMDGKPVSEYFGAEKIKNSEIELLLKKHNLQAKKIMLLTVDDSGNLYVIDKERKQ